MTVTERMAELAHLERKVRTVVRPAFCLNVALLTALSCVAIHWSWPKALVPEKPPIESTQQFKNATPCTRGDRSTVVHLPSCYDFRIVFYREHHSIEYSEDYNYYNGYGYGKGDADTDFGL